MPVTIQIYPIIPAKKPYLWQWDLYQLRIKQYMKGGLSRELIRELGKTTAGWNRKPAFVARYDEPYGTRKRVHAFPFGRHKSKWIWIDQGTGPRSIKAKGSMPMRFQPGYAPKTTPGGSYGGPGRNFGPTVRTYLVRNHRIEPRNFSERIGKAVEPKVNKKLQQLARQSFIKL